MGRISILNNLRNIYFGKERNLKISKLVKHSEKMNWKWIIIGLILFFGLVYVYNNPEIFKKITGMLSSIGTKYDSIEAIANNCNAYVGKQVTIRGTIYGIIDNTIKDDEGYWIWVATPPHRVLNYGETYTLTGTIKYDKMGYRTIEDRCYIQVD